MHHVQGLVSLIIYRMSIKKHNCHRTCLSLWSLHMWAVLLGSDWPLLRLAWNDGKLLTQALSLNGACELHHCDVTTSLAPFAQRRWHSKPNVSYSNSLERNVNRQTHISESTDMQPSRSVYAPSTIPCDCCYLRYGGGDNAQWISMKMAAPPKVPRKLCITIFSENMEYLWVSCYHGNNYRAASALFVNYPRAHGECLRQNRHFTRGMTSALALSPQVTHKERPRSPGHYP